MNTRQLQLLAGALVFFLIMLVLAVRPKPPQEIVVPGPHLGTVRLNRDYQILRLVPDSTSADVRQYIFLLYDEGTNSIDSLMCPVQACDTVTTMRTQMVRVISVITNYVTGHYQSGLRVNLNPYGPNQLTPMPYNHRTPKEHWSPNDSLRRTADFRRVLAHERSYA